MKLLAIIQARMSSKRLPGKVLLPLAGQPVLWHVIRRVEQIRGIDEIVVATSTDPTDDPLEEWCSENGVAFFRGDLNDVLRRFFDCMTLHKADAVVRITADCPLLDPQISSLVIDSFLKSGADVAGLSGSFPDGLDTTVFTRRALVVAHNEATLASDREHVGPFLERNPERFHIKRVEPFSNQGHVRLTLDEPEDYTLLEAIFRHFQGKDFDTENVLSFLEEYPELAAVNSRIVRNEGYFRSLEADSLPD